jgi:hypothetical protein
MNKYFNVTHVQKALQHHARIGHDALTDPRTAHIDGKKYGMALGHTLIIQDTNSRNLLTSHVLQDEKPVVSEIRSASTPTEGRHSRGTSAWVPHPRSGFSMHDEEGSGHDGFFEENNKSTNGLWLPHPDHTNSAVKDIHEHLATHNKIDTTNWHAEGKLNNLNEKMAVFTHPLPVFSGLIDVLHRGEDNKVNKYIYNPDTEQLHKRTDEDSE